MNERRRILYCDRLSHLQSLLLFSKDLPTHLKDHLESFTTLCSVFLEAFDTRLFYLIPDLLPSTTEGYYFSLLLEFGPFRSIGRRGLIDDGLPALEQVRPCHVGAAHSDLFRLRINI